MAYFFECTNNLSHHLVELDLKTKLDYQEYFEIPAILFATLSYALWLSFARIGTHSVASTTWPLIWLGFRAFLTINPFPLYYRPSRAWLYRIFGRLLLPGTRRVEVSINSHLTLQSLMQGRSFSSQISGWGECAPIPSQNRHLTNHLDYSDQFCSLVFPLSNLYFFGCIYVGGFPDDWRRCSTNPPHWGIPLALAALPLLVRLIQSIKRWYDSRVITHLINVRRSPISFYSISSLTKIRAGNMLWES